MMNRFLCLLAAATTVAAPLANASVLNITELSVHDISIYMTLQDVPQPEVNGIHDNGPGSDVWIFGPTPLFGPSIDNNVNIVGAIAWIEPGGSLTDLMDDEFNTLEFDPSGNRQWTLMGVNSDLTYGQVGELYGRNGGFFNVCSVNGFGGQPCPILTNGQSYNVPINIPEPTGLVLETLTVTFHDQSEGAAAAAPEPVSLSLLAIGLAGLGLRRRKQ